MSKYYTPKIEEFHVDFEYEKAQTIDNNYNLSNWKKVNDFSNDYEYEDSPLYGVIKDLERGVIRVKYLDNDDIEELGFRYIMNSYAGYYTNDKINIAWYWNKQGLEISQIPDKNGWGGKKIFSGKIKNKSELKKLLKQLEIN